MKTLVELINHRPNKSINFLEMLLDFTSYENAEVTLFSVTNQLISGNYDVTLYESTDGLVFSHVLV